jgi:hypothetical protein
MSYECATFTVDMRWTPDKGFWGVGVTMHGLMGPFDDRTKLMISASPQMGGVPLDVIMVQLQRLIEIQQERFLERWGVQDQLF